jgi:hypothetical protein
LYFGTSIYHFNPALSSLCCIHVTISNKERKWSWSKLHTERTSQVFVECVLFYFSWLKTNPSADAKQRKNLEWPYQGDDQLESSPWSWSNGGPYLPSASIWRQVLWHVIRLNGPPQLSEKSAWSSYRGVRRCADVTTDETGRWLLPEMELSPRYLHYWWQTHGMQGSPNSDTEYYNFSGILFAMITSVGRRVW